VLTERVRDDAADTMRYFTEQGVALKVISGDNPRTVGAVAVQVGVPGVTSAADAVDARQLPEEVSDLAGVLEKRSAFGRVTPQQKREVVGALQSTGHVVAMTGDGVNDALALKDADIGVAMGNGSPATRAVAQLVLLDGKVSHLPDVVAEGRRVIANIERAANLFLVKNIYSLVLALITGITLAAYPLAPIQLTLISTLTIGVPGFVLALGPNKRRYVPGFLRRVLRFAIPTGIVTGVVAYLGYWLTRLLDPSAGVAGGRTTATITVLIVSLWVLVVLTERVRDDAADTMRYFTEQGVALKVISGDNPRTVGAVAAQVGVPGVTSAADAVDARQLPEEVDALAAVLEKRSAFGRVTPQQKRGVVGALQSTGHVVAMTGDGVNDALALKDADIGVAMGNGSPATRAVAQLVLLDGKFSHLPDVVAEGRRVIANIERAANLFLVKNIYSLVLALITGITLAAYPLAPIQLTLISTVTIGIPGFVLALAPNKRRYVPGFLSRVLRFAIPTGIVTGVAAYLGYSLTRVLDPTAGVAGGRTTATITVLIVSLWVLVVLARPLAGWKLLLVASIAGLVAVIIAVPALATDIFLLYPTPLRLGIAAALGAGGALMVELSYRAVDLAVKVSHSHRS
jgi:magnesium-transporting ATPase (P-type)